MAEEWVKATEGKNKKYKRETLLNYAANRWALNKKASVDAVSLLIRKCSPKSYEQWVKFYFDNACQGKKHGHRIDKSYIEGLGKKLFQDLSNDVKSELNAISEKECIDYMFNLVLNRTYEGYMSEIQVIYGELQNALGVEIKQALS